MGFADIIKNVKSKGLLETNRIRISKKYNFVSRDRYDKVRNALDLLRNTNRERRIDLTKALVGMNSVDSTQKKLTVAMIMRDVAIENSIPEEGIVVINNVINEIISVIPDEADDSQIVEWNRKLLEAETGKCRRELKELFLKGILPEVYSKYSKNPIEDKIIFMESGNSPSPSSKHLSEVIKAEGKYKVLYMGLKIRQVPTAEFYMNAIEFVKELATAKAVFLSTANELLSQMDVREETKVIQLWHGVGAFKHVGRTNSKNPNFGKSQKQWEEYDSYRNYTAVTTAAEGQNWIFEDAMNLKPEQIAPIGVARTDLFFDDSYKEQALQKLHERYPQIKGKKIILYAPTFRGKVGEAKAPDRLDIAEMAGSLLNDYVLLVKHHGLSNDIPSIPDSLEGSFAFDLNRDKVLDIDELLCVSDILITDYSSVAFEFAIMERPIVFFTYDLEDYIEQRGLYFDFNKEAPGPICRNTSEIVEYVANIEKSFDKEKLMKFKEQYVSACDGHATERTIALLES